MVDGTYLAREYLSKTEGGRGGLVINISSMAGMSTLSAWFDYTLFQQNFCNDVKLEQFFLHIHTICDQLIVQTLTHKQVLQNIHN